MNKFIIGKKVLSSEILWVLTTVMSNISTRAAAQCQQQFSIMFPDSDIATIFSIGKDKEAYITTYGIFPYFKERLIKQTQTTRHFSISYDEALNKHIQKTQMDIHIRFWDDAKEQAITRYLTSEFLESTKATDLLEHLYAGISHVKKENLISLSMDGPNVNWKMLSLLKSDLDFIPDSPKLLEIGSCSLHVIHGALKHGVKIAHWDIYEYLRSSYYLFKDFPSRKGMFKRLTESDQFPVKFCCTRWVENEHAAAMAIKILPNMRKFINEGDLPNSKVYFKVKNLLKDPCLAAKMGFFCAISRQLERFLIKFQKDDPMVPFLYEDLHNLIRNLMKRFVKDDVLEKAVTANAIMKIDLNKNENLISAKDLDLYTSAKVGLRNITAVKLPTSVMLKFKEECHIFLTATVSKLIERCPLKYSLTRALSCIAPRVLLLQNKVSERRLDLCIEKFIDLKRVDALEGDGIKEDFYKMLSNDRVISLLNEFDEDKDRLDNLFSAIFRIVSVTEHCKNFIIIILTMFHGNAAVERGFSLNKMCMFDNMIERSLIAKRLVKDEIKIAGGPQCINICDSLILSCKNASARRKEALEKEKSEKERSYKEVSRKRLIEHKLNEVEVKKRKIREDGDKEIAMLMAEINVIKNN